MFNLKLTKGNIDIYSLPNPALQSFCIGVCIKAGCLYETPETNGYAHLFEHIVFRNVKKQMGSDFYNLLAKNSIEFYASTYQELIIFKIHGLLSGFDFACKILEIIFNDIDISTAELNAEKARIKAEMREEDERDKLSYLCKKEVWKNTNLEQLVFGYCKNIDSASVKRLNEFKRNIVSKNNVFIVMTGNVTENDISSVKRITDKLTLDISEAKDNSVVLPDGFLNRKSRIILKNSYWTRVYFSFDHRCKEKDLRILNLIYEALFTGDSAIIYQNLSENNPYIYSFDYHNERYRNAGTLTLDFDVDERNLLPSIEKAVECFNMIKQGNFDFDLCLKKFETAWLLDLDNSYNLCTNLSFELLYHNESVRSINNDIEYHHKLSKEEITKYAKKLFITDNLVFGVKGNKYKISKKTEAIKEILNKLNN